MPFEKKKPAGPQVAAIKAKNKGEPKADPAEPDEDDAAPAKPSKSKPSKMGNLSAALAKAPGYGKPSK